MEYEDNQLNGPQRHDARDTQGARYQQLRLRAAREVPPALRARRPQHRLAGAVGDGGVQAAAPLAQRRALQAHLGHVDRLQEHCLEDCQRAQVVIARALSSGLQ